MVKMRPRLQFGPFTFDQELGELSRDGQRIALQEKPRQVLAALLERPGEVATREELREKVWGNDTFVDFEHGLNTAIKKVRQALGDSAETPQFIETLSRRGYRFLAPVVVIERPGIVTASQAPVDLIVRRSSRVVWWGLLGVVLFAAAAGAWIARDRSDAAVTRIDGPPTQLAVLPLRVLGHDAGDLSYLGTGIADAITTRLANVRQIGLRPTSAGLMFKDDQADTTRIASALGVQYLLLGTIQPTDQAYRFSVQLVRSDGVAVWGRSYDEPRGAVLAVQDHIAEQIVAALRLELSPPTRARLHVEYTKNAAASDLYLRGRALLVNYTDAKIRESLGYFERAVALDEHYAAAHAALATGSAWFSVRYAYEGEALTWGKRAETEARLALDQDPLLADAHLALASAAGTLYGGFNWNTVLQGTEHALSLDPSLDLAHVVRMRAFYHLGAFDQARDAWRKAQALNPSANVEAARLVVAINLFSGQYAEALNQATSLLAQTDAPAVRQYLGLARFYTGDRDGARATLASVMGGGKPDVRAQASLASVEAATGARASARRRAAAIGRGPYMDHHVAYSLGAAYAQLGEPREAIAWLGRAVENGFPCTPWFERDPLLDPIRREPEFQRLLAAMRR
jgi:DNA-binding winged helix-turn-helix (wHTH) protein/TolB-like protein/Tfp pilus assembly protein PilF